MTAEELLEQFARIGEPPLSLLYHYGLVFVLGMAAAMAIGGWWRERNWPNARLMLAALGVMLLALINLAPLVILDLLGWEQLLNPALITPVLARAVSALTLLLIIWICAFPTPARAPDIVTFGLLLVVLILGGASAFQWTTDLRSFTFYTNPDNVWESVWMTLHIVVSGAGSLLLAARRRDSWLIGLLLLLTLLPGYLFHSFSYLKGADTPFLVRYLELIAMPMFAALVYRRVNAHPQAAVASPETLPAATPVTSGPPLALDVVPPATTRLDPRAITALASLNSASNADELAHRVVMAGAHASSAEVCLLLAPPDELGTTTVTSAYHRERNEYLTGTFLSLTDQPQLLNAFAANGLTSITPEAHAAELRRLTGVINIGQIGPTLVAPLRLNDKLVGALVAIKLNTSGAQRTWSSEEEQALLALREPLADALSSEGRLNRLQRSLDKAQGQAASAEEARRSTRLEADQLRIALEDARSEAERLNQDILRLRQEMQTAAESKTPEATDSLEALREKLETVEFELETHRQDLVTLQTELAGASERLAESEQRRSELTSELQPLRENVAAFTTQLALMERLRAEVQTVNAHRAELQTEIETLRAVAPPPTHAGNTETARQEIETLSERLAQLQTELELAHADTQAVQAQRAQLEKEITELRTAWLQTERQAAAEWRERYETTHKELETARHETVTKTKPLLDERVQLQVELKQLREQLQAEKTTIAILQTELEAAAKTGPLAEAQTQWQAEVAQLREKLDAEQAHATTLQLDYDFVVQQEQGLRADLENAQREGQRWKEQAQTLAEAETTLQSAQAELMQLHQRLSAREHELTTASSAASQVATQAAALVALQAQFEAARQQLNEAQTTLARKEQQLAEAQSALALGVEHGQRASAAETELKALRTQLAELQTALRTSQGHLNTKERELNDAMAALAELSNQTHALTLAQKELADKEQQLAVMQANLTAPAEAQPDRMRPFLPEASMEIIISLSQELRQPLAAIVGYSDLLLGESVGILGMLQRKFMERVKASCERMEALLNDLIRVTDIDAGTLQLVPESLDVFDIVEDAILSCGAQFREKSINLRLNVADHLPSVSADRDALRQIFTHLLSNAGNASGVDGEVVLHVHNETGPAAEGQGLRISVRDTGGGIAPEDQPRVFTRHFRADAPLVAGLGDTGVGLSVAKALVEAHGGRIWFTSETGKGSTFNVLLPVQAQPNGTHLKVTAA